jgi:hypothetical protein
MFDKHFIVKVQIKGVLRFSKNFYFILQYSRLLFMGKGSERRKPLRRKSKKRTSKVHECPKRTSKIRTSKVSIKVIRMSKDQNDNNYL